MSDKILVSYVNLGVYIAFIVVGSLLVSLLPIYVNQPTCEPTAKIQSKIIQNYTEQVDSPQAFIRHKHDLTPKQASLRAKLINALPEELKKINSRHPELNLKSVDLPLCPELTDPQPIISYPWYEKRLPKTIVPINYDLFLFLPLWGEESVYDGQVIITVDVKQATNLIILHKYLNELPEFQSLTDKNGNNVDMDCTGEYYDNDFLIFRAKNNLQPQNGPYKLKLFFIAFLNKLETGLYEFNFSPDSDASNRKSYKTIFKNF